MPQKSAAFLLCVDLQLYLAIFLPWEDVLLIIQCEDTIISDHIQHHIDQFVIGLFFIAWPDGTAITNIAGQLETINCFTVPGVFVVQKRFQTYPIEWILEQLSQLHDGIVHLVKSSLTTGVLITHRPVRAPIATVNIADWPRDPQTEAELTLRTQFGISALFNLVRNFGLSMNDRILSAIEHFQYTYQVQEDWGEFAWLLTQHGFDVYIDSEGEGLIEIYTKTA